MRCQQLACTPVRMANYSEEALAAYVATGDPLDKAGAYAIQAETFAPVAGLEGCYTNVVGLPLCHLYRGLRALGLLVPAHPLEVCPQAVGAGCPWAADILSARPEGMREGSARRRTLGAATSQSRFACALCQWYNNASCGRP